MNLKQISSQGLSMSLINCIKVCDIYQQVVINRNILIINCLCFCEAYPQCCEIVSVLKVHYTCHIDQKVIQPILSKTMSHVYIIRNIIKCEVCRETIDTKNIINFLDQTHVGVLNRLHLYLKNDT